MRKMVMLGLAGLSLGGSPAFGQVFADLRGDFVPGLDAGNPGIVPAISGLGVWEYFSTDPGVSFPGPLDTLAWDTFVGWYEPATGNHTNGYDGAILSTRDTIGDVRADEVVIQGGSATLAIGARFTATQDMGRVIIETGARRRGTTPADGFGFRLFINSALVLSEDITDPANLETSHTILGTRINAGDEVGVFITHIGTSFDSTAVKLTLTPTPGAAASFIAGAVLVARRSRSA